MHAPVFSFCAAPALQHLCFPSSLFISIFASPLSFGVPHKWRIVCFDEKLVSFFSYFRQPMTHVHLLSCWQYCTPSEAKDQWMNSAKALSCTIGCANTVLNKFSIMLYVSRVHYSLFGCKSAASCLQFSPLISISNHSASKGNFGSKWNAVGCFK